MSKTPLMREIDKAAGRFYPTETLVENVQVTCRACGGVTVFPVLRDGGIRPTPAPCAHCGADV